MAGWRIPNETEFLEEDKKASEGRDRFLNHFVTLDTLLCSHVEARSVEVTGVWGERRAAEVVGERDVVMVALRRT
jgi:hypothetical protein